MKREQAILGVDAAQFATVEDAAINVDDDLLGGGIGASGGNAAFETQFPDITTTNEVQ